jgi:hypothetical protein
MPRGGGVARDVGFIDNKKRKEGCLLTQETGPCKLKIDDKKCPEGIICDDSGQVNYEKCSGNSPREKARSAWKDPLRMGLWGIE